MIEEIKGDLLKSNAEALVNTVNTVGVMGKGVTLQFRQAFSENYFKDYQKACRDGKLKIGKVHIYDLNRLENPKYIINFPTKKHWKGKSRIEDINAGLKDLVSVVKEYDIKSIAVPPLGCGNGGLNWTIVRSLILSYFDQIPEIDLSLYAPAGSPKADEIKIATKSPNMTTARAALLSIFQQYLLPGYRLSMLEVQKLAYFLQASGEDLRLKFAKQQYGPYTENVNHVLRTIDGHFISGYGDHTQKAVEPTISLITEAVENATSFLEEKSPETLERLLKVSKLIEGFEYPHGLELLSTVHWVVSENPSISNDLERITNSVQAWNSRKKAIFSPNEIKVAWRQLQENQWI
jgi:O-acetyl-ADP-ribose deacetylase (regulator of RNase III)